MSEAEGISVGGQKELFKALDKIQKNLRNKILRTELRKGAKEAAAALKAATPESETSPEAGELKREVKVRSGKKSRTKITFIASIKAPDDSKFFGSFPEMGTKKQKAQHFGQHSADESLPELADSIPDAIWAAIEGDLR